MSPQPCAIFVAALVLERVFRGKARSLGNTRQAARLGDLAIHAMRQRFRHVDGCKQCLLVELEAEAPTR